MILEEDRDAMICRLIECLGESHSIESLVESLDATLSSVDCSNQSTSELIHTTIEAILNKTSSFKEPSPKKRKISEDSVTISKQQHRQQQIPEKSAFDILKAQAAATKIEPRQVYLTKDTIETHLPCQLFHDWLPKPESNELLQFLMKDASKPDTQWSINKYFINERETLSSHKSALFTSIPMDEFKHTFQGGDTTGIPYSPLLQAVSEKVDDFVTGKVREKGVRLRTAVSRSPLDSRTMSTATGNTLVTENTSTSGRWNGNFCIANEYLHGKQITGFHADSLAYIGPRPVIVSLSLGATRTFRVRKIKGVTVRNVWEYDIDQPKSEHGSGLPDEESYDSGSKRSINGGSSSSSSTSPNAISSTNSDTTYSIKLPHGSLLIMYPPMQELYKHEIGPERNFAGHPISGLARYNLTFRMYRPEFSMPPFCKCNIRTDLKPVFKRSSTLDAQQEKEEEEKYYYACVKGRGGQLGCGFFEWLSMKPVYD